MIARKKNLLDAFKASATEGPRVAGRKNAPPASAGGPFAPPAPTGPAATPPGTPPGTMPIGARPDPAATAPRGPVATSAGPSTPAAQAAPRAGSTLGRARGDPTIRVALVAMIVAVAAAFWIGRTSATSVAAEEPALAGPGVLLPPGADGSAPPRSSDLARTNQTTAQITSGHDQAFMDPKNRFTVRCVQYKNDEAGIAAARATHDYLQREGYPVVSPIVLGKNLIVCVGARPKYDDLAQMLNYVQTLRGPDSRAKKPPFADAYVVNIDDVVER